MTAATDTSHGDHNGGLSHDSVHDYGVKVIDGGVPGCDLSGTAARFGGTVWQSADCETWQTLWPRAVARYRPQVVGVLIGRFELGTHLHDGTWVHLGEPAWDAVMSRKLDQAVRLLAGRGAKVVLFTYPYVDPPTVQLDGNPWPENRPARVDAWNRLLRTVAARFPGTVTVVDLHHLFDPHGHFAAVVDGVRVRWSDGIHVTTAGGEWLQSRVLPEVARLGLEGGRLGAPAR